ncbi:MAG: RCC1 repeat- and reductase domain-containing protein [Nitrospirae bacterium]|nr:RCC1 repeat- and reductase domain-containing protein [Nitrospirota bacterium]
MSSALGMIAYKTGGVAWMWGSGTYGMIGANTGTTTSYSSPVAVVGNHSFIMIWAGIDNGVGLKQDGSAWVWGGGDYGQIGNQTQNSYSSPVAVVGNHSFISLTTGARFCLGLKTDGSVWTWGNNGQGQLGNQSTASTSSPVAVVGNHSFRIALAGGITSEGFCAGLKADGSLWTWGDNAYGQLGNNSTTGTSSPVAVTGNHSFISFSIADRTIIGLKADGSAWGWGYNNFGCLGTQANVGGNYSSPVAVVGNHSFVDVHTGPLWTAIGLKADGSAWCWGSGSGGQIGNNTVNSYSSPVAVVGNHSFIQINSIEGNVCAGLKSNGSIWTWGTNSYGLIGNNTLNNYSSPVAVVGNHSFLTMRTGQDVCINVGGVWKRKPFLFVNNSGTWERIYWNEKVNVSGTWCRMAREIR